MTVFKTLRLIGHGLAGWSVSGALCGIGAVSVVLLPELVQGQTPAPVVANTGNRSASPALTAQTVRLVALGRPLGELQRQIESALGMRLVLAGNAADAIVNGDVSGQDGLAFLKDLASRLRLEWAVGKTEVYLGSEGSARPTTFITPSATVANKAAALANQEFESQGSNIRVIAKKEELTVTGLPAWVSQVGAIRLPALIDQANAELQRSARRAQGLAGDEVDDPLSVMVFQLNNAYVDDKRLNVGSSVLIIPGVARLFRQFTGMAGGSTDSTRASTGADPGFSRVARIEPIAGGRPATRDNERLPNENAEEMYNPMANADFLANRPAAIGDTRMNTLVVRDRSSRLEMHRALIKVLDQPANMVQLEAYVIDIKASRLSEFGLGLSWGGPDITGSLSPGGASPANANVILQSSSGAQLLSRIRALETTGESEILSVPSVVTLNNLEATFSSRENFYVRVSGNQDAALSKVTAETLLKVTPLVTNQGASSASDKRIRLLVSIQDGSVDATNGALVDSIPRTLENQISTQAVVRGGDTLVIGGQVVRKKVNVVSGLPVIKDIPILGALTSSKSLQYETFVRVYVVRPTLLGEDSAYASTALSNPADVATGNNPLMQKIPELMRGISIAPEGSRDQRSEPYEDNLLKLIPVPRTRIDKPDPIEQSESPSTAPVSPSPGVANSNLVGAVGNPTGLGKNPELKVDQLSQQVRDRDAMQILDTELAKAEQFLRKFERDAGNGSTEAREAVKRIQADIESIQRERQRLASSTSPSVKVNPVR